MADTEQSVKVELSDTIHGGFFVIDDQDVDLVRGKGRVTVVSGEEHSFHLGMQGARWHPRF